MLPFNPGLCYSTVAAAFDKLLLALFFTLPPDCRSVTDLAGLCCRAFTILLPVIYVS
jgi:hypothetical protein